MNPELLAQHMYEAWAIEARRVKLWLSHAKVVPWAQIGSDAQRCWIVAAECALAAIGEAA